MEQETFCFNWKNFSYKLSSNLSDLLTESSFSDVTLVSADQIQIPAHKFVLSACSPVLRKLLLDNPHPHPLLLLRGVIHQDLLSILQLMYLGEARVCQDRISNFLDIAKDFQVKELTQEFECFDNAPAGDIKNEDNDTRRENVVNEERPATVNAIDLVKQIFQCSSCESVYKSKKALLLHNRTKHEGVRYSCDTRRENIVNEERPENVSPTTVNAIDLVKQTFQCSSCESVYKSKKALLLHNRTKHEGVRYSCEQCGYCATTQASLKHHTQTIHEGVRYACNQCDFQAAKKYILRKHKRSVHEGISYFCDQCEYQASIKGDLKRHKHSKHEGVVYSCNTCAYQAKRKDSLQHHRDTVHNGYRFSCDQCDVQCKDQSNLKRHQQSKHEEISYSESQTVCL